MIDDFSLQKEEIENIKMGVLRKFPLLGATMTNLKFEPSNKVERASTDNEFVYFPPKYLDSLNSYGKKVFLFSHEIMHVALDHILRSAGKDFKYWNMATDAVINQLLIEAGLPMIEDGVDIKEASGHSADEMYEIFMKEKEEQEEKNQQNKNKNGEENQQQNEQNQNDEREQNEQAGHDEHEMWKEVLEKIKQEKEEQEEKNSKNHQSDEGDNEEQKSELEKSFTKKNEELKKEWDEQIRKKL